MGALADIHSFCSHIRSNAVVANRDEGYGRIEIVVHAFVRSNVDAFSVASSHESCVFHHVVLNEELRTTISNVNGLFA